MTSALQPKIMTSEEIQNAMDKDIAFTENQVRDLIFEGHQLGLEIKAKTARHELIKRALVREASARPLEHAPAGDGDGTKWILGAAGCRTRVTFPKDSLKDQIVSTSKAWKEKILKKLGTVLPVELFDPVDAWAPKADFRKLAVEKLGPTKGASLIRECSKDSAIKCEFEEDKAEVTA